jgi:hypothetical protein
MNKISAFAISSIAVLTNAAFAHSSVNCDSKRSISSAIEEENIILANLYLNCVNGSKNKNDPINITISKCNVFVNKFIINEKTVEYIKHEKKYLCKNAKIPNATIRSVKTSYKYDGISMNRLIDEIYE